MYLSNFFKREKYKPGDLGFTIQGDDTPWLAEVLQVDRGGYKARLIKLFVDDTGRYSIDEISSGTYGYVPRNQMQNLRFRNMNFKSLAEWQKREERQRGKIIPE